MLIAIGADHGGYEMREFIIRNLSDNDYTIVDCGVATPDPVDYPDIAVEVCRKVIAKDVDFGIVICGTGIGISIAANKIRGIRAALCANEYSARMARQHNNANVLALGGRVIGNDLAVSVVKAFLDDRFSGADRHQRRIDKMMAFEDAD